MPLNHSFIASSVKLFSGFAILPYKGVSWDGFNDIAAHVQKSDNALKIEFNTFKPL